MRQKGIIVGLIAAILAPFYLILDRITILIAEVFDLVWTCFVKIPMEIGDFGDKIQVLQYVLDIIHNFTSQPLLIGIMQSISPFPGC